MTRTTPLAGINPIAQFARATISSFFSSSFLPRELLHRPSSNCRRLFFFTILFSFPACRLIVHRVEETIFYPFSFFLLYLFDFQRGRVLLHCVFFSRHSTTKVPPQLFYID